MKSSRIVYIFLFMTSSISGSMQQVEKKILLSDRTEQAIRTRYTFDPIRYHENSQLYKDDLKTLRQIKAVERRIEAASSTISDVTLTDAMMSIILQEKQMRKINNIGSNLYAQDMQLQKLAELVEPRAAIIIANSVAASRSAFAKYSKI